MAFFLSPRLAAGLVLLLPLSGCVGRNQDNPEVASLARQEAQAARKQVESGFKGARLVGGELSGGDSRGRPLWRIAAREIVTGGGELLEGTPRQARLSQAEAILYREGVEDSRFGAEQIELFNTGQGIRLKLSGKVIAKSTGSWVKQGQPVSLTASRADLDIKQKIVSVSGKVQVVRGPVQVEAGSLKGESSLKQMTLSGGVRAKSPGGVVTGRAGVWDWSKDAVRVDSPSLSREGVTVKGARLLANTRTERGVIEGMVQVASPAGSARGSRVEFDWSRNQISARQVTLISPQGQLKAEMLTTDSAFKVTNATRVSLQREGWQVTMASAQGFDRLGRIAGKGVVVEGRGARLTAAQGHYGAGKVAGSGGITLSQDGNRITGDALESDTELKNARVVGRARAVLKDGTAITAARLSKVGDKLLAEQGIRATSPHKGAFGALAMKAGRLETRGTFNVIQLSGNVEISGSSGAWLTAPEATYNRLEQKLTASGKVTFFDPERGLEQTGDSLSVDLKRREAVLNNVSGAGSHKLFEGKNLFE